MFFRLRSLLTKLFLPTFCLVLRLFESIFYFFCQLSNKIFHIFSCFSSHFSYTHKQLNVLSICWEASCLGKTTRHFSRYAANSQLVKNVSQIAQRQGTRDMCLNTVRQQKAAFTCSKTYLLFERSQIYGRDQFQGDRFAPHDY